MSVLRGGWYSGARRHESPNRGPRPTGVVPDLLVLHCISLPPGEFGGPGVEDFFCNDLDWEAHPYFEEIRGLQVSTHFLIRRDGEIVQFVSCDERAWHAGQSCFEGRDNCNDFSVGIELEGTDNGPFESAQYASLVLLSRALFAAYPEMAESRITGHSDIAPGRKTDPGPGFDWTRFHALLAAP
ncbi:MAG: 1,6-anhydro-N-acetylmuramyl-L-alanine amidase AmpD [Pseudomonadota bacterium]